MTDTVRRDTVLLETCISQCWQAVGQVVRSQSMTGTGRTRKLFWTQHHLKAASQSAGMQWVRSRVQSTEIGTGRTRKLFWMARTIASGRPSDSAPATR